MTSKFFVSKEEVLLTFRVVENGDYTLINENKSKIISYPRI